MTVPTPPERTEHDHSPAAERLKEVLGWDHFPEMTPEQRTAYEAANQRAEEDARRFYGESAA